MAVKITLERSSTQSVPTQNGYQMDLTVTAAEDIAEEIFVNQRIQEGANTVDNFVAVATPTQLSDYPAGAPVTGSSFFRTSTISLVFFTLERLEEVFQVILKDLDKLVTDHEVMLNTATAGTYEITPGVISQLP